MTRRLFIFGLGFSGLEIAKLAKTEGWTVAGTWHYLEYPQSSHANSYLYESAGSKHTLHVPEDSPEPADVIFIVHGSNIELGATGEIEGATSAMDIARAYLRACREQGLPRPDVMGLPPDWE